MVIVGEKESSDVLPLSKRTKVKFKRGSVITCTLYLRRWLGQLLYLHVWHDNSGDSPAWNLDHVVIRDTRNNEIWNFMCQDWLAVESKGGRTDKVIYVAPIDELTNYKHLFLSNSADGLYDEHLWISVAAKPPQSSFTRVQRASCCLSVLFCTMITNAMFYDDGRGDTSPVFSFGPLKISNRQVLIGIQSSLIIFPVNLAITQLFRKTSLVSKAQATEKKPKTPLPKTKPSTSISRFVRGNHERSATIQSTIASRDCLTATKSFLDLDWNSNTAKYRKLRKKHLYTFLYYTAWVLCFVCVGLSAFFTLLYSMQWGKENSEQWLLSFFISFVQDAAVSQPVKVSLFSAIIACFIKISMKHKKHKMFVTKKERIEDVDTESYFSEMVRSARLTFSRQW